MSLLPPLYIPPTPSTSFLPPLYVPPTPAPFRPTPTPSPKRFYGIDRLAKIEAQLGWDPIRRACGPGFVANAMRNFIMSSTSFVVTPTLYKNCYPAERKVVTPFAHSMSRTPTLQNPKIPAPYHPDTLHPETRRPLLPTTPPPLQGEALPPLVRSRRHPTPEPRTSPYPRAPNLPPPPPPRESTPYSGSVSASTSSLGTRSPSRSRQSLTFSPILSTCHMSLFFYPFFSIYLRDIFCVP